MNAGQTLAHYEVIRPLGKGGIGEVYLARGSKLKREVAIKVLLASAHENADCLAQCHDYNTLCAYIK
jgi:serine/threonine protein kinase